MVVDRSFTGRGLAHFSRELKTESRQLKRLNAFVDREKSVCPPSRALDLLSPLSYPLSRPQAAPVALLHL